MRTPSALVTTRLNRQFRALRRQILIHRRALTALLVGVSVFSGLRAVQPTTPALSSILVAARDLPAGTRLDRADLTGARFPDETLPEGRIRDPVGSVLAAPVRRGEVLTDARVLGPGLTSGASGLVALPVRISDPGTVSLLRVGDLVDLIAVPVQGVDSLSGAPGVGAAGRVVARAVRILAIPPTDSATHALATPGRLVVLGIETGEMIEVSAAATREWLTVALHE